MPDSSSSHIEHISDTARWVAVYRAMESARPDAIFRDPYAARLAGARGQAIVDTIPRGRANAWPMIVRTALFDEIILRLVRERKIELVVNLAAGLDARAWRLPLPAELRWVDVDLPDILHYKTEMLKAERPVCRYETVAVDLRDEAKRRALFSQLGASSSRALVVTEGLLIYLEAEQVKALARDLAAQPSFRWWLFDLAGPLLLKMTAKSWQSTLERGNAPFRFAPEEGTAFFADAGWREVEFRSIWEESHRLRRSVPGARLWRFLERFSSAKRREATRRISATVLLERA